MAYFLLCARRIDTHVCLIIYLFTFHVKSHDYRY